MNNFKLRPYSPSDAQAVVDVINPDSMQTVGFLHAVVDSVGNIWAHRFVPFSREKILATEENNEVVGYAYFSSEDDHIVSETGASIHPA
jgi:hypothetical protein